jgi:steroid 5-alpha reductase family enzyme
MTEALPILLTNLIVTGICFTALWLISIPLKDPSYVDSWWGLGVVVLAWSTYVQLGAPGPHATALLFLASAWGLRLGIYLIWRWRNHGHDRRYAKLAERAQQKHGLNFAMFSLLWVFGPQLVLQMIMSLPAQLGQIPQTETFGAIATIGLWLSVFGIIYEGIADAQLAHFKSLSDNKDKVMDRGLWRYSRHPNYFGELCCWWGIWLIALDAGMGLWSLPGPLLITFLLTRVSGAPTTEPHLQRTRPDYEAYKKRTSAYFPLPPKKA